VSSLSVRSNYLTARQAVDRLRDLVTGDDFAAHAAVDRATGELVHSDARSIFSALPVVSPQTTIEELIEHGLLVAPPRGLMRALGVPRYRRGRELFVRTRVSHKGMDKHQPVGGFADDAPEGFTHRAVLVAEREGQFLVELEGAREPLAIARESVFSWNEPTSWAPTGVSFSGVQIDYNDPLMRAHVCAAYIDLSADLERLDFGGDAETVLKLQAQLVRRLSRRVAMDYIGRGNGYTGPRAAALLSGGQGVCFVQRAAAAALLAPFSRTLAFDMQVALGRTLRLGVPHGFLVLTLRPSLARYVVDPAWGEPLTDLRVAFFGPAWGHDRKLEGFEGGADTRVGDDAVDLPAEGTP
jgi:hypothetical protein